MNIFVLSEKKYTTDHQKCIKRHHIKVQHHSMRALSFDGEKKTPFKLNEEKLFQDFGIGY
jgi:hypothetical protein